MRGLDTNVLVRFLLRDDPRQAKAANMVVRRASEAGDRLLVSVLTLLETEWVLRAHAGLAKGEILGAFKLLLESRDLPFEQESVVEEALYHFEEGRAEFADCLRVARYRNLGCSAMLTFDARSAKLPGGELLAA